MPQDSLILMPLEKWPALQKVFLADWPRSLPGYNVLETQSMWKKAGLDYGFKVYSPDGDEQNGFVAINEKESSYDIIIQYPKDDTNVLEAALKSTEVIAWNNKTSLQFIFIPIHVAECTKRVFENKNFEVKVIDYMDTFYIDKTAPLFESYGLPPGCTFVLLTSEHVNLVDSLWPHRFSKSSSYFQLLIDSKTGYGLFKDGELISWIFVGEIGHLTNLYTLEGHRKMGYAELLVKLVSTDLIKDRNRDVFAFCLKGNYEARKLYKKLGMKKSTPSLLANIDRIDPKNI